MSATIDPNVLHLTKGVEARLALFREWCRDHPRSGWIRGAKRIRAKYRYAPKSVAMSAIWREVQAEIEAAKPPKKTKRRAAVKPPPATQEGRSDV